MRTGGLVALQVSNVQVWAREVDDRPGALADVLRAVAEAGGNVECVVARREPSMPGKGQVFVTLGRGRSAQDDVAAAAGLTRVDDMATLRVEGADQHGLGGRLTGALEKAQINVRGVTAAVIGGNFVCFVGLDSAHDAQTAIPAIKHVKGGAVTRRAATGAGRARGTTGRRRAATTKRRKVAKRPPAKRATAKRRTPAKRR
jgi:predicted amino acid-binding ACT domain protein